MITASKKRRMLILALLCGVVIVAWIAIESHPKPRLAVTLEGLKYVGLRKHAVFRLPHVREKPRAWLWRNPIWTTHYIFSAGFEAESKDGSLRHGHFRGFSYQLSPLGGQEIIWAVSEDDVSVRITNVTARLERRWNVIRLPFGPPKRTWTFEVPPPLQIHSPNSSE